MKKNSGLTIIETVVSISIFVILLSMVVINYNSAEKIFALERSAYNLAKTIRTAQEKAMSSKEFNGAIPSGGYGIYVFTPSAGISYSGIFADINENGFYDDGEEIMSLNLEKNIIVKEINFIKNGKTEISDRVSIIFLPPDPNVVVFYRSAYNEWKFKDTTEVSINLCHTENGTSCDDSQIKGVKINRIGLISAE